MLWPLGTRSCCFCCCSYTAGLLVVRDLCPVRLSLCQLRYCKQTSAIGRAPSTTHCKTLLAQAASWVTMQCQFSNPLERNGRQTRTYWNHEFWPWCKLTYYTLSSSESKFSQFHSFERSGAGQFQQDQACWAAILARRSDNKPPTKNAQVGCEVSRDAGKRRFDKSFWSDARQVDFPRSQPMIKLL